MTSSTIRARIRALAVRYKYASKTERSALLDHLLTIVPIHRKHAIRLLRQDDAADPHPRGRQVRYDPAPLLPPLKAI